METESPRVMRVENYKKECQVPAQSHISTYIRALRFMWIFIGLQLLCMVLMLFADPVTPPVPLTPMDMVEIAIIIIFLIVVPSLLRILGRALHKRVYEYSFAVFFSVFGFLSIITSLMTYGANIWEPIWFIAVGSTVIFTYTAFGFIVLNISIFIMGIVWFFAEATVSTTGLGECTHIFFKDVAVKRHTLN